MKMLSQRSQHSQHSQCSQRCCERCERLYGKPIRHKGMEIWFNCRTSARHYKAPGQNQTLCGLSLKQGHAWDKAQCQQVTCSSCLRVAEGQGRKRRKSEEAGDSAAERSKP